MNNNDAKGLCENKFANGRPGYLVEPKTSAINKLIFNQGPILYWIGINDIDNEDSWVYTSTGLPATTTFFDSNHPNARGDCAIACTSSGEWCDTSCDSKRRVICEF